MSVRQSGRRPPPAGDMDRGTQQFDHGGAGHAGLQPLPCVARGSEPPPVRASVWLFRTRETGPTVQAPPVTSPRCDGAGFLPRLPTRQPLLRRQNPPAIQGRSTKLCRWAGSVLQLVLRLASADTRRVHRTGPVAGPPVRGQISACKIRSPYLSQVSPVRQAITCRDERKSIATLLFSTSATNPCYLKGMMGRVRRKMALPISIGWIPCWIPETSQSPVGVQSGSSGAAVMGEYGRVCDGQAPIGYPRKHSPNLCRRRFFRIN